MNSQTPSRSVLAVGGTFAFLLGSAHVINHSLEVFGNLQPPLQAARGVAMWAVIFLVSSVASTAVFYRTGAVLLGAIASIVTAAGGAVILVVSAIAVGLALGEPLSFQTIVGTGGLHVGGSAAVGFGVGLASGVMAAALSRANRAIGLGVVAGSVLLLAAGLSAIAHATNLERSARPPFIMFGLPSVAIALTGAAPAVRALTRTRRAAASR